MPADKAVSLNKVSIVLPVICRQADTHVVIKVLLEQLDLRLYGHKGIVDISERKQGQQPPHHVRLEDLVDAQVADCDQHVERQTVLCASVNQRGWSTVRCVALRARLGARGFWSLVASPHQSKRALSS